jgi:hypothetical protein
MAQWTKNMKILDNKICMVGRILKVSELAIEAVFAGSSADIWTE